MKTNDLKKGMVVQLRNGWFGVIADNKRGNTRMVKVYGDFVETGSVYSHDIAYYFEEIAEQDLRNLRNNPNWIMPVSRTAKIEHTKQQLALMK